MDEPLGSLDAQTRELMQEHLTQVCEYLKKTVVFVTHDLEEAVFLADNIYVLTPRPGRLRQTVTVAISRPRQPAIKTSEQFFDIRNKLFQIMRGNLIPQDS
jgi:ABC-type nitrate/sulfonate/bicarbonate transport system ATPase subunit